jgi:hypothetical protein
MGEIPPAVVAVKRGAAAGVEEQYAAYLREERGLARATLLNYLPLLDRFLVDRFGKGPVRLAELTADDVTRFVLRRAHTMSPGRAKLLVTVLRSFLRFLFLSGESAMDLTPSVPTVADWRLARPTRDVWLRDAMAGKLSARRVEAARRVRLPTKPRVPNGRIVEAGGPRVAYHSAFWQTLPTYLPSMPRPLPLTLGGPGFGTPVSSFSFFGVSGR